jgi:hypothetical protein
MIPFGELMIAAGVVVALLEILIARPPRPNAEGMVAKHLERNRVDMRPANERRR